MTATSPEIARINDLRLRIVQARDLRAAGRNAEADALYPSVEDLRDALIALRASRESIVSTKLAKREKENKITSMDLSELFTKPTTDATPTGKE